MLTAKASIACVLKLLKLSHVIPKKTESPCSQARAHAHAHKQAQTDRESDTATRTHRDTQRHTGQIDSDAPTRPYTGPHAHARTHAQTHTGSGSPQVVGIFSGEGRTVCGSITVSRPASSLTLQYSSPGGKAALELEECARLHHERLVRCGFRCSSAN